ncbi:hypothetical protein CBL_05311 [Carabus blaptoides fortunei]
MSFCRRWYGLCVLQNTGQVSELALNNGIVILSLVSVTASVSDARWWSKSHEAKHKTIVTLYMQHGISQQHATHITRRRSDCKTQNWSWTQLATLGRGCHVKINIPRGAREPSAWIPPSSNETSHHRCRRLSRAGVKYERNTSRAKMNRIHHVDVFVRFVRPSNVLSGSRGREKLQRKRRKNLKSRPGGSRDAAERATDTANPSNVKP